MDIDPLLRPYAHGNEPLPTNLKPILDAHLETSRSHISACEELINETKAKIRECHRKMLEREEEMEGIRQEMGRHMEKKNELNIIRQKLASTTSAIRRLPPEIIASIMWLSVCDDLGGVHNRWLINLCAVSRVWRDTALSTPTFWRTIIVELGRFSQGRSPEEAKLAFSSALNKWLSRGGKGAGIRASFNSALYETVSPNPEPSLQVADVVDWIRSCDFSFSILTFEGIFSLTTQIETLFSPGSSTSLQMMKMLILDVPPLEPPSEPPTRPSIDLNLATPNLESLQLFASNARGISALFTHPGLTTLVLAGVEVRGWCLANVVRGFPALRSLALQYCYPPIGGHGEPFVGEARGLLAHPSLREIYLSGMIHGQFFHGIACPRLERLDFGPLYDVGVMPVMNISDASARLLGEFIQRSEPPNLLLHLGERLSYEFLNTLLLTSIPYIKTLDIQTPGCVPMGNSRYANPLAIPSSITRIQSAVPMEYGEEVDEWIQRLATCLENSSSHTLHIGPGSVSLVQRL